MPTVYTINPLDPEYSIIENAASTLRRGSIFIYPTETLYGLGAVYDDDEALEKICSAKQRDREKPLPLLISSIKDLDFLASKPSRRSLELAQRFWPGPLTLVFRAGDNLHRCISGSQNRVGCRISSNPVAQHLVMSIGKPIIATSANLSGESSSASPRDLPEALIENVDILIDAGPAPGGQPSTVVDVSTDQFTVLRSGAIDISCPPE